MPKKNQTDKNQPLAIVGIGCLFPKANNPTQYWINIREGIDAIGDIPESHWRVDDYFDADQSVPDMTYARRGGFIDLQDFNPLLYGISPNNIEATDTTQLLGMLVARQALLDAGYSTGKEAGDGREFNRDRTSVILGVTGTLELVIPLGARLGHPIWRKALQDVGIDPETTEDIVQRIADGYVPWQENSFPGLLGNVVAGRIANRFDLGGTNCVVDAACASSLSALHLAALELQAGRVDMAITGGMDTFNDIFMHMCFSKTPALSPTGNSRPFAKDGDGTILGEGLGAVILKRRVDAERDGDNIYAILKGMGASSDGRGNAIYAPGSTGQTKALWNAYNEADVSPRSITLVEAHGTGTSLGDAVEATALSEVYAKDNPNQTWCAVGSVKSMIGHTKAAAGVAGLIKTTLALKHKVLPPSIKVDEPLEILDPGTAPIYLNTVKRPWITNLSSPRRAALSSFGFGGSNFHCVLEEAEVDKHEIDWDGNVVIMALSAASADQLVNLLPDSETLANWDEFRFYCYDSCQTFADALASRLIAVFDKESHRDNLLQIIRKRLLEEADSWSTPNVFYQNEKSVVKSAFIFPGQGSQYVGMGRDLACQFPRFFAELENANRVFTETSDALLTDFIYPIPVFNAVAAKQQEADLRQTQHAQPAIGAVSLGCLNVLEHFGVEADATLGHSYGELTALTAAGSIEPEQLHYLSRQRGELMNSGAGDRGGMIAVMSSPDVVESFMHQHDIDLVVANHNSPEQVVLSGASEQVDAFAKCAKAEKIRAVRLPVAAAFHSRYVADAAKPFARVLADIQFLKPKVPVLSNMNTEPYPDNIDSIKRLLSEQLANPVRFVEQIERLYQDGVTHFIEVGPGKTLSGLVDAILSEQPHHSISIDVSCGKKPGGQYDLAILLAKLAVAGFAVDLRRWDSACAKLGRPRHDAKPAMMVAVGGANIMQTRPQRPLVKTKHRLPSEPDKSAMSQNDTKHPNPGVTSNKGQSSLLQATQESILALQKMQEQTARLHQQYLEGQETAQQTIQLLLAQQQALLQGEPLSSLPISTQHITQPTETMVAETSVNTPDSTQAKLLTTAVKEIEETRHQQQDIDIDNLLLRVVSEKTGYPLEMLSLDMSLDTDLGIDSIKRVEILSAIQEQLPWSSAIKSEELGTFQFLQHIVEFLAEARSNNEQLIITESTEPSELKDNLAFQQTLVSIVAEKTGYPESMLSMEMNLDSDLGIDSIKRVEILSAMQERIPGLPAVSPEQLSQLKTLQSIIEVFTSTAEANEAESVTNDSVQTRLLDITLLDVVADKTGYPVDMLNLDMHLDSDLGIDSIKRVEILSALHEQLPGLPVAAADDLASLQTLQQIIDFILQRSRQQSIVNASNTMSEPGQEKQHTAEIETSLRRHTLKLAGLDVSHRAAIQLRDAAEICVFSDNAEQAECLIKEITCHGLSTRHIEIEDEANDNTSGLIIHADSFANNNRIVDIFELLQRFSQILQRNSGLLVSLSNMGGDFGIQQMPLNLVSQAACHGMVKTADKEWSSVQCRCLDVDQFDAEKIIDEMLQTGPIETALHNGKWNQLTTSHTPLPKVSALNYLNQDDVIVISGGARGVTAEVAVTLAETYQCNLILLGRSPEPTEEPKWLRNIDDKAGIKRALLEHADHTYSPAELAKACSQVLANREIGRTLSRIRNTGAAVNYCSVDITDFDSLEQALNLCRIELGNIIGIVHAAGVLADRLIEEKTRNQFEQVYKTKVEGLQNLLHVTSKDKLKLIVMFSSTTARLGRKGQSDYAAANEVLNKIAQYENQQRQGCKVLSINWGPWNGGMVTSSLRKLFAEEGVGVIGLKQGAEYLIHEIETDGPVELMILADHVNSSVAVGQSATRVPDFSQQEMKVAFERELSVNSYSFLSSHVMNGQAVLPVSVIIEWFAHGALHLNPGMQFHGFNDFRVLKGVTLTASDTVQLRILVGDLLFEQGMAYVPVELRSGQHLHASAVMVLTDDYAVDVAPRLEPASGHYQFKQGEYYQNGQLFHGQQLQGIKEVLHCDDRGIVAEVESAPAPTAWMKQPIRSNWLTDPLILDSAFQLMILWSFENQGIGSLPTAIQSYCQFQRSFPKNGARIIVGVTEHTSNRATATIEFLDSGNQLIAIMEAYECVRDGSLRNAFKANDLSLEI